MSPLTFATMAASASRGLMDLAISIGRLPSGAGCLLPSGRVISILIGKFQSSKTGVRHLFSAAAAENRCLTPVLPGSLFSDWNQALQIEFRRRRVDLAG